VFWALRDLSFTVEQGETVGIIGPNGAGKSTVLKLISRIIEPTSGDVEVHGRVGALLELGAGFHPDLSGRENIYLNGSILGLSRGEIEAKVDQIVAFSELERFIDMPIRHYSSGMRMRLGFSVAAHLDPEILLVDEVLAVGDENFQHKCLDRIMEIRRQGVTICFVSHGLGQIRRLCTRAIWLNEGSVRAEGAVDDVISAYLRYAAAGEEDRLRGAEDGQCQIVPSATSRADRHTLEHEGGLEILDLSVVDAGGVKKHVFQVGETWVPCLRYRSSGDVDDWRLRLTVRRSDGVFVWEEAVPAVNSDVTIGEGEGLIRYRVDDFPILEGTYDLSAALRVDVGDPAPLETERFCRFRTRQVGSGERYGLVSLRGRWAWQEREPGPVATPSLRHGSSQHGCPATDHESDQRWGAGDLRIVAVSFLDGSGTRRRVFEAGETWIVHMRYQASRRIEEPVFGLAVHRDDGVHVCGPNTHFGGLEIPFVEGEGEISYQVQSLPLARGDYVLSLSAHNRMDTQMYDYHDRLYPFKVAELGPAQTKALVKLRGEWEWQMTQRE
jgi:lipopolysaccharide transport system ATP-binding protein